MNEEWKMQNVELKIYDVMSRVVYQQLLNTKYEILNTHLSPGIYFVKVSDGKSMSTQKVVIE